MQKSFIFFLFFICFSSPISAQLTINVNAIPNNSPVGDDIFVAGNFNNWAEGNTDYILSNNGDNTFSITINPNPGLIEFKFTRGTWATVEGDENGNFQANHTFNYDGSPSAVSIPILSWEDQGAPGGGQSTATYNVQLVNNNFYIPQLDRYRTIWIYLPPDYNNSNKNYPVIYMQDGQNLFDAYTSFSGEWEVDESLNSLFDFGDNGAIIVGINNGGADRLEEYTPWSHPNYGGGNAEPYVNFIVETLKPFIDANYRTYTDRNHTGIMGSSLGGLLSMYAAIEHQDVFSKAGVFSPSFWFSDQAYSHVSNTGKEHNMKFYLMASEQEDGGSVVDDVEEMNTTLINAGFNSSEINVHIHQDGAHSEWFWAREFPDAYLWLCANSTTSNNNIFSKPKIDLNISSNILQDVLTVQFNEANMDARLQVHNLDGKKIIDQRLTSGTHTFSMNGLSDSLYILNVWSQQKVIYTKRLVLSTK